MPLPVTAVAILENPFAGNGAPAKLANWLLKELALRNIPSAHFKENWPTRFDGFSDIWLIGGDGTIHYFINRYPDCALPLALFKGGTGNDFAWKLYGDLSAAEQLEQVLHAEPRYIDAGKFNQTLFINCLGVGFDGEIIRSMRAIRLLGGHIGYLLAVIGKIFTFREQRFRISNGTEHWDDHFLLVMVVNSSRAGGGFFIAPTASVTDGKLDLVLCTQQPLLQRLRYLPIIKKGKHMHLPFVIHRLGEQFTIQCEKLMDIQADGDLYTAQELTVEILPGKFCFRY